jgi:PST family polysaccharide transporter/lipopolysaccharide exporter
MGAAMVLLQWMDQFTQTGVTQALIQKPADVRPYLDTAFTVQALRGIGLFCALVVAAPLASSFFKTDVTITVRVAALMLLLRGFNNPAVVFFRRDLDFRRDTMWRAIGTFAGLAVAVVVGVAYRNVWALLLSLIAAQTFETATSYWVSSFRPKFAVDRARSRELFAFGRWVFLSNLVSYFGLYADSLAVGRFLGPANLGSYQVAVQLSMSPIIVFATHVSGVSFPAFSKVENKQQLAAAYLRVIRIFALVTVPVGCMLAVFGRPIVRIVLGPKWLSIANLLPVLSVAGIGMAVAIVSASALMAVGRPDLHFRVSAVRSAVLAVIIYPLLARYGNIGVASAVAVSTMLAACYSVGVTGRLLGVSFLRFLGAFRSAILPSAVFLALRLLIGDSLSATWVIAMALSCGVLGLVLRATLSGEFKGKAVVV